ncbi:MAG: glycosyltransferase family 2 protein [Oscillospiraceae bacterium]|nr:glycosyltransferase family 2 protein [Oscillospiraceae bacterium]
MPLVSFVIPIYNTEKYIKATVNSILDQDYKDIEIVAVNDGSTDKSLEILNAIKSNDNRLKIINTKNHGVSSARNTGIDNANGEWIYFIDSDDLLLPNSLSILINHLKDNSDIIMTKIIKSNEINTPYFDDKSKIIAHNEFTKNIDSIGWTCFVSVSKFIRKDLIIKNNIKFDTNIDVGEDQVFSLAISNKANKISVINTPTYEYVIHSDSTVHKIHSPKKESGTFKHYIRFINDNNTAVNDSILFRNFFFFSAYKCAESLSLENKNKQLKQILTSFNVQDTANKKDINKNIFAFLVRKKAYKTIKILFKLKNTIKNNNTIFTLIKKAKNK